MAKTSQVFSHRFNRGSKRALLFGIHLAQLKNVKPSLVHSAALIGINAHIIKIEVDISDGMVAWHMVGLPEKVVQESKERVWAAIRNVGIRLEARKTTVNLAPVNLKKQGSHYDLPIALGLLACHGVLPYSSLLEYLWLGELSLTGELRPICGSLAFSEAARKMGLRGVALPQSNEREAGLISKLDIVGFNSLSEVLPFLLEGQQPHRALPEKRLKPIFNGHDLSEVNGQVLAKRALEISAAGGHHLLMIGPPGSGKTMLAQRLPTILPPLTEEESIEVTKIYSSEGLTDPAWPLIGSAPFRAPHHSASYAGMIGGGHHRIEIGEITLAHRGVLFLDEAPEFHRDVLEALRQPLESGQISLVRTGARLKLPCKFQLVVAMNPCMCGFLGHPTKPCRCPPGKVFQYRRKLSGPLLDRIDLHVELKALTKRELFDSETSESSGVILKRVLAARQIQKKRYSDLVCPTNSMLTTRHLKKSCPLTPPAKNLLGKALESLCLSARAYDRILKVGRTIADLGASETIEEHHIAEAIQYRVLDRDPLF